MEKQLNPELAAKLAKMTKQQVVDYFSAMINTPKKKVFDLVIFKGDNNNDFSLITIDLEQHHIDRMQADLDACKAEINPDQIPSAQMHVSGTSAIEQYQRTDPSTGLKAVTHFNTNKDRDNMTVDRISFHSEKVAQKKDYKGFRIAFKRDEKTEKQDKALKAS
jgi:hypothetical protein